MADFLKFVKDEIENLSKVGIYSISHQIYPKRLYIGSTSKYKSDRKSHYGFYKRFYDHYYALINNEHHSKFLQRVVNKYGVEGLIFSILEICENKSLLEIREKEQNYIDILKPCYNTFNTVHPQGRVWTRNQKIKQSEKMRGISLPKETYEKAKRKVTQLSKSFEVIKEWNSISEASKSLKIDCHSISNCIAGRRKSAGGYIWK